MSDAEERAKKKREEEAELHTKFLNEGLTKRNRKPHPPVADDELSTKQSELQSAFNGKSIWELWCEGNMTRWYIMQWAVSDMGSKAPVAGLGRFLLRTMQLHDATAANEVGSDKGSVKRVCTGLKADSGGDAGVFEEALPAVFAATRRAVFDAPKCMAAIAPLLEQIPSAVTSADDFLSSNFGKELARAKVCIGRPIPHDAFIKPMNLAVGGFGIVDIAWSPVWAKPYALKRQNMAMIVGKDHISKLKIEWRVHRELRSPFILDMLCAYTHGKDLVMALRYMAGGDLSFYIRDAKKKQSKVPSPNDMGHFGLDSLSATKEGITHDCDKLHAKQAMCRFYLAATLLGLEALHAAGFVYRDLKDMNILLDANGQARIADFGLCADVNEKLAKGPSGTKGYWAPEQLDKSEYALTPDYWTFGVCVYHWNCLKLPFPAEEEDGPTVKKEDESGIVKAKILTGKWDRGRPEISKALEGVPQLESLLEGLLTLDPKARLGCGGNGWKDVKAHPYWKDFPWEVMERAMLPAPITPKKTKMNAAPPSTMKEEFVEWANKDIPEGADETFKWWEFVNLELQSEMAIEAGDKDTAHFAQTELDAAPTKSKVTWNDLTAYDSKNTLAQVLKKGGGGGGSSSGGGGGSSTKPSGGSSGGGGGGNDAGGGGGCCVIA